MLTVSARGPRGNREVARHHAPPDALAKIAGRAARFRITTTNSSPP